MLYFLGLHEEFVSNVGGSQQSIEAYYNDYTRITSGCIQLASVFQMAISEIKRLGNSSYQMQSFTLIRRITLLPL